MNAERLTRAEEESYADLARWAETVDAAESFVAGDGAPDDDAVFRRVQEAARREL